MQDQIYSIYHLSIDPSYFDAFEALIQPIVAATSEEADTTIYEYVVNAERTVVHIVERYRTGGVLPHVEETFSPFAERFLALATIDKLYVYGDTTEEIRAKLDGFGAEYLAPFAGFFALMRRALGILGVTDIGHPYTSLVSRAAASDALMTLVA